MANTWPTISLMIPTVSRPTLVRCLQSVRVQRFLPGDEVILMGDGPNDVAKELFAQFRLPGYYRQATDRPTGDWGHTPRNVMMPHATGTHIMALDDDDELTAGALWAVREALFRDPTRPHLFKMNTADNGDVWKSREVKVANVGTPMFVIPTAGPRSAYLSYYGGDHAFIRDTLSAYPAGSLVWDETVICRVRPHARV